MMEFKTPTNEPVFVQPEDIEGLREFTGLSGTQVTEIRMRSGKEYVVTELVANIRSQMQTHFYKRQMFERARSAGAV